MDNARTTLNGWVLSLYRDGRQPTERQVVEAVASLGITDSEAMLVDLCKNLWREELDISDDRLEHGIGLATRLLPSQMSPEFRAGAVWVVTIMLTLISAGLVPQLAMQLLRGRQGDPAVAFGAELLGKTLELHISLLRLTEGKAADEFPTELEVKDERD